MVRNTIGILLSKRLGLHSEILVNIWFTLVACVYSCRQSGCHVQDNMPSQHSGVGSHIIV